MSAASAWLWPDIRWHEPQAKRDTLAAGDDLRRGPMLLGKPVGRGRVAGDLLGLVLPRAALRPDLAFTFTAQGCSLGGMLKVHSGRPSGSVSTSCAATPIARNGAAAHRSGDTDGHFCTAVHGGSPLPNRDEAGDEVIPARVRASTGVGISNAVEPQATFVGRGARTWSACGARRGCCWRHMKNHSCNDDADSRLRIVLADERLRFSELVLPAATSAARTARKPLALR